MKDLTTEYHQLNEEQKKAVLDNGNTVLLAGPGSGKTATLVIKVAYLLIEKIQAPHGLACITYNNDTVRELKIRLAELGVIRNRRLFIGTVHSFCLNQVLRPYANLVISSIPQEVKVVPPKEAQELLEDMLREKYPRIKGQKVDSFTRLRRLVACREDINDFPEDFIRIFRSYQDELKKLGLVDYEEMVTQALKLIEEQQTIRDGILSRFPWLIIDEYQDLGGPLHQTVIQLLDRAGVNVFAVGDPDQTIYPFTGADPKYLLELKSRPDFREIRLKFNYRSGKRLIMASEAVLDEQRNYEPDPKRGDEGEVYIHNVPGGLLSQADYVIQEIIPVLRDELPLEEIAILYRAKGGLFDALQERLLDADIPFVAERDGRYPKTPIVRWLQDCANWCVNDELDQTIKFEDLFRFYNSLLESAGQIQPDSIDLTTKVYLYKTLTNQRNPDINLSDWLLDIDKSLKLRSLLSSSSSYSDALDDFEKLLAETFISGNLFGFSLRDFSTEGRTQGKVVLTTIHSSKGRQFSAVIMPGLQETILPSRRWSSGLKAYVEPTKKNLSEERRLFYVGFTRAKKYVFLLYSDDFYNDFGYPVDLGPSRFILEVKQRLEQVDSLSAVQ